MISRTLLKRSLLLTLPIFLILCLATADAQQTYLTRENKENYRAELRAVDLDLYEKWKAKRQVVLNERKITLEELYMAMYKALDVADYSQHHDIKVKYLTEIKAAKVYYADWERTARKELIDTAKDEKLQIKYRYLPETRPETEVVEIMP